MQTTAVPHTDFEVMQSLARALRAHVDSLPDGAEIVAAVRAEVEPAAHPPEPPPTHGRLVATLLELLRNPDLSPDQSQTLRATFLREQ
jgi:hypothetical protein